MSWPRPRWICGRPGTDTLNYRRICLGYKGLMTPATVRVPIGKVDGRVARRQEDLLAVEEPLEIRVGSRSLSVTMRTPGHDCELAAGFLFAEDIIGSASQIQSIANSSRSEERRVGKECRS